MTTTQDVSQQICYFDPDVSPVSLIARKNALSEPVTNMRFEWDDRWNLTQIFRDAFGMTGLSERTEAADKRGDTLRKERAIAHCIDIEASLLYGLRNIDNGDAARPIRYTGGLTFFMDEPADQDPVTWLRGLQEHYQGRVVALFAGDKAARKWRRLLRARAVDKAETYGITMHEAITPDGMVLIANHRLMRDGPHGTGFGGDTFGVSASDLLWRPLGGRDTFLRINVGREDDEGWTDEYLTEVGLEYRGPATAHLKAGGG